MKLIWSTSSEKNSDRFIIERSSDGKNFIPVGEIAGAGFFQQLLTYSFSDYEATGTGYYYRLQIVDMDGSAIYSHVIHVTLKKESLLVFPNPGDGQSINTTFTTGSDNEVNIKVSDLSGKTVYQTTFTITNGRVTADFSPKLVPGFYILVVKNGAEVAKEKLSIY